MGGGRDKTQAEGLQLVRFRAGQWILAIEASRVEGVRDGGEAAGPRIESLLGIEPSPSAKTRTLLLREPWGGLSRNIVVCEPVQLERAPAEALFPLPALTRRRCGLPGLRAIAFAQGAMLLLIGPPVRTVADATRNDPGLIDQQARAT